MVHYHLGSSLPEESDSFEGCDEQGLTEHLKRLNSWAADHSALAEAPALHLCGQMNQRRPGSLNLGGALFVGHADKRLVLEGTLEAPLHNSPVHSTKEMENLLIFKIPLQKSKSTTIKNTHRKLGKYQ